MTTSHIAHTSLRVSSRDYWYFDSGYSIHMTEEKNYFKEVKPYSNSYITFGDGVKGNIMGKRKLDYPSPPSLEYVF